MLNLHLLQCSSLLCNMLKFQFHVPDYVLLSLLTCNTIFVSSHHNAVHIGSANLCSLPLQIGHGPEVEEGGGLMIYKQLQTHVANVMYRRIQSKYKSTNNVYCD